MPAGGPASPDTIQHIFELMKLLKADWAMRRINIKADTMFDAMRLKKVQGEFLSRVKPAGTAGARKIETQPRNTGSALPNDVGKGHLTPFANGSAKATRVGINGVGPLLERVLRTSLEIPTGREPSQVPMDNRRP